MQTSTGNIQQTLSTALVAHEAGRIDEAAQLYGQVLQANPAQFDALQMLGLLQAQAGHGAEAEALLRRAIAVDGSSAILHFNLGNVLNELGRLNEAIAAYEAALVRDPGFAEATIYRAVLLGLSDRTNDALAALDALLARGPNAEALYNRANIFKRLGQHEQALADYDHALSVRPDFVEAWFNRGNLILDLGRPDDALASYDNGLATSPGNLDLLNNRGSALLALDRADEALAAFDVVAAEAPDFADVHYNRGNALAKLKRPDEALAGYEQALTLNPDYAAAAYNRGNVMVGLRQNDEALASFDYAIRCRPDYAEARYARSQALIQDAKYERAIADLEWLLAHGGYEHLKGDLHYARLHCCDWRDFDRSTAELVADVRAGKRVCHPFNFLATSGSSADQLECAEIEAAQVFPAVAPIHKDKSRTAGKIRLGYVSGEFREQATAFLLVELIERHDKHRFEVVCFDNGFDDNGPTRKRLNTAFDRIIDISTMTDDEAARTIADADIDILLNLNGYFGLARHGVFARRAAPIQVNYLGFPGTIGASCHDYIIGDPWVTPAADTSFYTERVVTLPDCYQPNDSRRLVAETPSRAELGLSDNAFVFCSFNNNYKLTPEIFDVWMRILRTVEGSVLWLLEGNDAIARNLCREAAARGVAPERLVFGARIPPAHYLARYRAADLFLDSLPYNAHTTASDALWMGLPVVTCTGTSFAGRVASSLLSALDLSDLITGSLADYEALAIRLALDPSALSSIHARLMTNRATRPLFDSDIYRRHIEAAFTTMIERHRAGLPPVNFAVPRLS
jgi:predicted O-linked N-acetylglucosamine transferase (SPINDLY family)